VIPFSSVLRFALRRVEVFAFPRLLSSIHAPFSLFCDKAALPSKMRYFLAQILRHFQKSPFLLAQLTFLKFAKYPLTITCASVKFPQINAIQSVERIL